jgi:hypothetical protein
LHNLEWSARAEVGNVANTTGSSWSGFRLESGYRNGNAWRKNTHCRKVEPSRSVALTRDKEQMLRATSAGYHR